MNIYTRYFYEYSLQLTGTFFCYCSIIFFLSPYLDATSLLLLFPVILGRGLCCDIIALFSFSLEEVQGIVPYLD